MSRQYVCVCSIRVGMGVGVDVGVLAYGHTFSNMQTIRLH